MPRRAWRWLPLVAMPMLAGCATADLQVDRAGELATAGRAATHASRAVIGESFAAHDRLVVEIATLDPGCALPEPTLALGTGAGRCIDRLGDRGVTLKGPPAQSAKAAYGTIDGLTAYLDAVDAIVTREPVDVAARLAGAQEELGGIVDDINAITGAAIALPSPEVLSAPTRLIALIVELQERAAQVRDLKALETELDAGAFAAVVGDLGTLNDAWSSAYVEAVKNEIRQADDVRGRQARLVREACPDTADATCLFRKFSAADRDEFRSAAEQRMALDGRHQSALRTKAALRRLNEAFLKAHEDYRILLITPDKAKLSDAERRKKARIIRQRLRAALAGIADIARVI